MNHQSAVNSYRNALDLSGAFIRRTNLSGVNLEDADLSGADCTNVDFTGANFKNANLNKTILRGANLTGALNLSRRQISAAVTDKNTILPQELLP
jgi:uncharacterized protein YjbI with pentapeptide repeats